MFIHLDAFKSIIRLALPLVAAFLAQKGMQVIDTLMMGWLGANALAAGALATAVFVTVIVFCLGAINAVGVFIVRARGAFDEGLVKTSLTQGIYLALLLTLPAAVVVWYAPHFLAITEKNSEVIRDAALLLHSLVWALPGVFLYMVFREYIAAFNLSRITMLVAIFSIPLTFVVNYVFIYGKLGLSAFGIAGIGYGGACVMWFMFIVLALYCKRHALLKKHLPRWYELRWHTDTIFSMLRVGVPSGTIYVLDAGMFTFGAMLVGYFSTTALAAYQITMQCASAVYSIPFGVSIATALQVGHAMGAKEFVKAKQSVYAGLSVGLIAAVGIALMFVCAPHLLVRLFIHPQVKHFAEISQYAASFFIAVALFQCFDAVQAILNGALRGLKDTFVPMIMSVGCYWVLGVGSAYYFSFHTTLKANGVLYGLTLGVISAAIALSLRFRDQQIKNMI